MVQEVACESPPVNYNDGAFRLKTIQVKEGSFEFTANGYEALNNNLKILKENKEMEIQIEGHVERAPGQSIEDGLLAGEKLYRKVKEF
ncbi:MAG: hypothetical protein KC483_10705, partial [Nitrosarchaeum sp.]|nr:hypothetical protein [Nitrosarchaeum sp.]